MGKDQVTATPHYSSNSDAGSDRGRIAKPSFSVRRLIFRENMHEWKSDTSGRLDQLIKLPVGWDGYNGRPVDFFLACYVAGLLDTLYRDTLPAPSIVPGGDGTLQVEWHLADMDIELDILAVNRVRAWRRDDRNGSENEAEVEDDFALVSGWLGEMALRLADDAVAAAA